MLIKQIFSTSLIAICFSMAGVAQADQPIQKPTPEQFDEVMIQMAKKINEQLPKKVDPTTTFSSVNYKNKIITYDFTLDNADKLTKEQIKEIKDTVTQKSCTTAATKQFIDNFGLTYSYRYFNPNKKRVFNISANKETCNQLSAQKTE